MTARTAVKAAQVRSRGSLLSKCLHYLWNNRRKKRTWHIMEVNRSRAEHELERHTRIIQMSVQDAPTKTRKRAHSPDTRLHGRWLLLTRGVWLALVVLTLAIL